MSKQNFKKIIIIFCILLLAFLSLNAKNFFAWYYNDIWNKKFINENYSGSIYNYNSALNWKKDDTILYNLAWNYFKVWDFENSLNFYSQTKFATGSQDFYDLNYNLWNTFYRIWEKSQEKKDKIDNYKKSLDSYKKVLDLIEDKKTKENYDFVEKKLKELENSHKEDNSSPQNNDKNQEWQNKNETNSWSQNETWSWSQNQTQSWSESKDENQQWQSNQSERPEEYRVWETDKIDKLTQEEKKELENYNLYLNQEQKNNIDNFWKQEQNQEDLFDKFMQDPFFDNFKWFNDSINQSDIDW